MVEYLKFHLAQMMVELMPAVALGLLFLSIYAVSTIQEARMKRKREEMKRKVNNEG